jgi:hypothetical protein
MSEQAFYKDTPPWLKYFTQQWQHTLPSDQIRYLQGRGPDTIDGTNYNMPLAFLTNMQEGLSPDDPSPAGPRWHGRSRTPGGQDLKAPWHPSAWREEFGILQRLLELARMQ